MSRRRIRASMLAVLLFASLGGVARAADCAETPRTPQHRVVTTLAALRALDAKAPVLLWLALETPAAVTPDLIKRLRLQPGSVLVDVDLAKADLSDWHAPEVSLQRVDLSGAVLRGADLSRGCSSHGSLEKADLRGARMREFRGQGTTLAGADFRNADLEGAVLTCLPGFVGEGCEHSDDDAKIDLRGARLTGADIAAPASVFGVRLAGAVLNRTVLPFDASVLAETQGAAMTSVAVAPAAPRGGPSELFSTQEMTTARTLIGNDPLTLFEVRGAAPSFGCGGANLTAVEKAICEDPEIAALDRIMADSWRRVGAQPGGREAEQAAQTVFLKQRNGCAKAREIDVPCVRRAYVERLAGLAERLRDAVTVNPQNAARKLLAQPVSLKPALRGNPLARRLLRAYGVSGDGGTLQRQGAGWLLDVTSFGGNGHTCAFSATVSYVRAQHVWRDPADAQSMSWVILPDGIVDASTATISAESCGVRASWPSVFFFEAEGS